MITLICIFKFHGMVTLFVGMLGMRALSWRESFVLVGVELLGMRDCEYGLGAADEVFGCGPFVG